MADVKWIKLSTQIFDNRKIRQIESLPDGDAIIVIWVKLLCLAGTVNDGGMIYITKDIPYTDQMLSTQFNRPLATIKLALKTFESFGMIEMVDDFLHVSNWEKYQSIDRLSELKEYNRIAQQKSRLNKKQAAVKANVNDVSTNVNDMSMTSQRCQCTDIDKEEDLRKRNNNICPSSSADVRQTDKKSDHFDPHFDLERCWKEYPNKKGKSKITKKALKELDKLGTEKVLLAIRRYKTEIERNGTDMQYIQHGSTFFNGGYADYLADDWKPPARRSGDGLPVYDDFVIPF